MILYGLMVALMGLINLPAIIIRYGFRNKYKNYSFLLLKGLFYYLHIVVFIVLLQVFYFTYRRDRRISSKINPYILRVDYINVI